MNLITIGTCLGVLGWQRLGELKKINKLVHLYFSKLIYL